MQQVTVYINRNRDKSFEGYQHGDPLVPAVVFEVSMVDRNEDQLLEEIFRELNVDQPQGIGTLTPEMIRTYHRAHPSLSIGDVVELSLAGESDRWAVTAAGFQDLGDQPQLTVRVASLARNFYTMIGTLNHEAQVRQSVFADAINSMPEPEARELLAALEDLDLRIQQAKVETIYN